MNGLILLGIPGSIIQLLTVGLGGAGVTPDPTIIITGKGRLLHLNLPKVILEDGEDTDVSLGYALPNGSTSLTWKVEGTVSDIDLLGSLDGEHYSVISNQTTDGAFSIQTNVTFIATRVNTGSGVTVTVTATRKKL